MFTFGVAIPWPLAGMLTALCTFLGRKEGKAYLVGERTSTDELCYEMLVGSCLKWHHEHIVSPSL